MDRYKTLLSHAANKPDERLSGVTDWAELPLTRRVLSAHGMAGDVGSSQKCPLSGRKALFYCYVGETEKGEIKKK